jgi:hypothetical protein
MEEYCLQKLPVLSKLTVHTEEVKAPPTLVTLNASSKKVQLDETVDVVHLGVLIFHRKSAAMELQGIAVWLTLLAESLVVAYSGAVVGSTGQFKKDDDIRYVPV